MSTDDHHDGLSRAKINTLKQLYFNIKSPACYAGVDALYREAQKERRVRISRNDVERFLSTQRTYTRHRRVVRRFRRMRTMPAGLHTDWQADLAIFDKLARQNDGYRYLLVCIDVLSRQLFVAPVRSKRSVDMREAFEKIFQSAHGVLPWKISTDQGLEFNARAMLEYFREKDIRKQCMYTHPTIHAGLVERANRTIKERLFRYFSEHNTRRWVDVVQKIIDAINASPCRSIGMPPNNVTFENAHSVREAVYKPELNAEKQHHHNNKFKVGDLVRVEKHKGAFAKGYTPNFTDELYCVVKVSQRQPTVYRLANAQTGQVVYGWFYAPEMCRVRGDEAIAASAGMYRVERIIRSRECADGQRQHFVKWDGYDNTYNAWVNEQDLFYEK